MVVGYSEPRGEGFFFLKVSRRPEEVDFEFTRERITDWIARQVIPRVIADFRDQESSSLTAVKARALLTQFDRKVQALWPEDNRRLRIALVARSGSFGQGIARMLMGHAYGLQRTDLAQFEAVEAARDWVMSK